MKGRLKNFKCSLGHASIPVTVVTFFRKFGLQMDVRIIK